jgi:hypothetical protein
LLFERGAIGQEALFAAIEALAKPMSAGRLHECIALHEKALRETDRGWAKTAQALVAVRDYRVAAAWVADWEKRVVEEPWMLLPAAFTFRMLNRMEDAETVSRKALLLPGDAALPDHQVYVALEDALNARTAEAARLLGQIDPEELDDVPRLFFVLAETLVAVQRAAPAARAAAFRDARKKAEDALASYAPKELNVDLSRCYRRWTARLAQDAHNLIGWAWGLWKKLRPSV